MKNNNVNNGIKKKVALENETETYNSKIYNKRHNISQEFYKIIKEEFNLFKGNVIKC